MAQHFRLPDGRNFDYQISGASDGFPLLFVHGTPGAAIPVPSLEVACSKKGLKLVTFSRAGYGGSTRKKGKTIIDDVADIQALVEHLGVDRCFVGGWSGGGPPSLACAARLPSCVAALCIAGVGPHDAEDLDFLAGQGEDNIKEYNAALQGEPELQKFCTASRAEILKGDDPASLVEAMSSLLPDVDKEALTASWFGEYMLDSIREALRVSADGWVDDSMSFIKPWGFDLSEIKVPVLLYQGSEDKMVPFAHGEWLVEHLPQDKLKKHLIQGQGHISIFLGREESMMDELLQFKTS